MTGRKSSAASTAARSKIPIQAQEQIVCAVCSRWRDFQIPHHLLEAVKKHEAVIFAGAGISTEDSNIFPYSFHQDVAGRVGVAADAQIPFPELMSMVCGEPDGRLQLLTQIRDRIDYVKKFPELYRNATAFHRELSTISHIENIITTNWDDFFEVECGAIPFVSGEDFAFSNLPGRKVFKLHGSINNVGSIVATKEDYAKCYRRLSSDVMGGVLKSMLATKTIIYVGYSFADSDFQKIHKLITRDMKGLRPHSYFVTLDEKATERLAGKDITTIITDGTYFLSSLKEHLVADHELLPDETFADLQILLSKVRRLHRQFSEKINYEQFPTAILTTSYQDGLIHALELLGANRCGGGYSNPCKIVRKIESYKQLREEHLRRRRYTDVAYIDGYRDGLFLSLLNKEDRKYLPLFYVYGAKEQPLDATTCKKMLSRIQKKNRSVYHSCRRIVKKYGLENSGLVLQHTPFLLY